MIPYFVFATGIENSYPTINGGRTRIDEMESCRHYKLWRKDFDLVQELGIQFLRYGPPIHKTWLGPGRYDWSFADETFGDLLRRNIVPIADLCHFGVPDWLGNFQNPEFMELFPDYARDFAIRFPWVQLYTPVNEMFVCATFSAVYGWWNEQKCDDISFANALKHIVLANIKAMDVILKQRPDALFVQSESSEYFHASSPAAIGPAEFLNERRFLSLDLNYGKRLNSDMYQLIMDGGWKVEEYEFCLNQNLRHHCIMGNDYYATNEHRVHKNGSITTAGEVFGYEQITRQYHRRYHLPVMHTETNIAEGPRGDEAVYWLWKEWANVLRLRNDGIPVLGFTWYSLVDQMDWDTALREQNHHVNPVGLFDMDRNIRAVGKEYKTLLSEWSSVLPIQSVCLRLPVIFPREFDTPYGRQSMLEAGDPHEAFLDSRCTVAGGN